MDDIANGSKNTTISSLSWKSISVIFQGSLNLLLLVILSRILTPRDFGIIASAQIITGFVIMFADIGISSALIQKRTITKDDISTGFVATIFLGLFFYLILWKYSPNIITFVKLDIDYKWVRLLALVFPISSLGITFEALLIKNLDFKKLFFVDGTSNFLGLFVTTIILALNGFGPGSVIYGYICQSAIKVTILCIINTHKISLYFSKKSFFELFSFGGWYSVLRVINFYSQKADNYIVGVTLGTVALGYYDRAFQIMAIPGTYVGNILDSIMFPIMSKTNDNLKKLSSLYINSIEIINLFMIPLGITFSILSPEIVSVVLGDNWNSIILTLGILFLCIPLRTSVRMCDSLARAKGALVQNIFIKIVYLVLVLSLSLIGSKKGLVGVAIGVDIATVINYIIMFLFALKLCDGKIRDFINTTKPGLLIGIMIFILLMPLSILFRSLHVSSPIMLLIGSIFYVAINFVFIIKFPNTINQEFIHKINLFRMKTLSSIYSKFQ